MAFNPDEHLTKLPRQQKNKQTDQYETVYDDYLEVKWRLVWFRDAFPHGSITTEEVFVDLDREVEVEATRWVDNPQRPGKKMKETYTKKAKGYARYKAIVKDGQGGEGTGTKSESAVDFPDYIEKAETGAIGRALAALGFGTQFTGDEFNEKHRIVDSPVKEDEPAASHPTQPANTASRSQQAHTNQAPAKPAEQKQANGTQAKPDAPTIERIKASADRVLHDGGYSSLRSLFVAKYELGDIADGDIPANIRIEMADAIRAEAKRQPALATSGK